jgi:hypothetical protein
VRAGCVSPQEVVLQHSARQPTAVKGTIFQALAVPRPAWPSGAQAPVGALPATSFGSS